MPRSRKPHPPLCTAWKSVILTITMAVGLLVPVAGCVIPTVSNVAIPPSQEVVAVPEIRVVQLNDGSSVRFARVFEMRWTGDTLIIRGDVDRPGNPKTMSFQRSRISVLLVSDEAVGYKAFGGGLGALAGFGSTIFVVCTFLVRCFS